MIDSKKSHEEGICPFTVGGGIRTVDDFKAILREGADKISINSSAVNTPNLIAMPEQIRKPVRRRSDRCEKADEAAGMYTRMVEESA